MPFYIIIKIYIFTLFIITIYSKYFLCKIIHNPIYPTTPILRFHSILIIEKNNIVKYAIDFSPVEDITNLNVICNLLLGKTIKGKIRIIDLSKNIFDDNYTITLSELEKVDPYLTSIIKAWGSSFQLYYRNCRHFSRFIKNYYSPWNDLK